MPALQPASVSIMAPPNPHLLDNPQRLKEVDDHIEHLRNMLKFLEDERRRLTAIPADAHPVGVPEVLGHIMEWGVHLDAFEPETLLQVSRHWNRVALGTPGVWARIVRKPAYMDNFSQFLHRCKVYLERSKSHPLLIDVDFLYFYFESPTNVVYTQFAELIQPHLHRCYHISLANPRESLAHLFSSLGPNVEHIAHYCANATHRGPPLALPQVLPKLRHLSGTFPLPIFANIDMPALEHLQIALSPVSPSFHDLLCILQKCPNLKCLLFDNVSFTLAVEPDLTGVVVPLPELKRLEFHCSGTADAMLLTSHCLMPNIRELCITGNMLPIPLELFRNITTLHCSDWDFPWFIRALRVATQLETLVVRSHGPDSPFHTELLPALTNTTNSSSSSLSNLTIMPSSTWLAPKLRALHLAALNYADFPMDAFLNFLRKRRSSSTAQTIEKIVLEDVSHLTDFNIDQLKPEVETVEVVKTTPAPISFPFLPLVGHPPPAGAGVGPTESPAAAMHPIILPPVAYGAPLITPPPVEDNNHARDGGEGIGVADGAERSPQHSLLMVPPRTRSISPDNITMQGRRRSRSPRVIVDGGRSRSRSPLLIARRRSRSPTRIGLPRRYDTGESHGYRTHPSSPTRLLPRIRRPSSPLGLSTGLSRSRTPPRRRTFIVGESRDSRTSSSSAQHSEHLAVNNLQLEPGQPVVEANEQDHFLDISSATAPDMLRHSTIIIRSPASSFSVSPRRRRRNSRGRSLTRNIPQATPPNRRSLLPSVSTSRSSTARSSIESRSPSRDNDPYQFGPGLPEFDAQPDLETFLQPLPRPRQIQATASASTDSTLPTGRDHTAFMVRNREFGVDHQASRGPGPSPLQQPMQPGSMRERGFSSPPVGDLRLFVPVTTSSTLPAPRLAATLPMRRQYLPSHPTIVHNIMSSDLNDRETQRTSITTISPSPRLGGSDSTALKSSEPKRRASLWSRLKSLVK